MHFTHLSLATVSLEEEMNYEEDVMFAGLVKYSLAAG